MSASGPPSRWSIGAPARTGLAAGGLLVLAALVVYAGSFSGPFVFDDVLSIPQNPTIRHLSGAFFPPGGGVTVSGRPVLNVSFALNYALSGDRVWSYHAANLLIHILGGLTLFGVVRRTLVRLHPGTGDGWPGPQTPAGSGPKTGDTGPLSRTTLPAFAAALLWLVHPLQTEAVTYVVQRSESLMGLFYLLTLYCFIRGSEENTRPRTIDHRTNDGIVGMIRGPSSGGIRSGRAMAWFSGSVLVCLLGMATKEVMVSAPMMVLLYDRCFVAGSFRSAWQRRRGIHLALAATWVLPAVLVSGAGNRGGTAGLGIGVGFTQYAATQFQAVAHYLWLSLWPHPLIFDYGASWVRGAADLVPYVPVVTLLVAGTAVALRWRPAVGFAGAWFLAVLAPTSLVPNAEQTLAEHRMYLALAPVIVLLVLGLHRCLGRRCWPVLLAAAVAWGVMAAERNRSYQSALAIWSDTAAKRPLNPGAHVNLGNALEARGRVAEALGQFATAARLDPHNAIPCYDAGGACLRLGRYAEAIAHYRRALGLGLDGPDVHANLGDALFRAGRSQEAVREYETALRMAPGSAEGEYRLGNALAQAGETPAARLHLEAALRLRPHFARAHNNLGNLLQQGGDLTAAVAQYEAALRDDPRFVAAHSNLGIALVQLGRLTEARTQFEWILRVQPDAAAVAGDLGLIHLRLGQPDMARRMFERVLALDPGDAIAHYNLGCAWLELGRRSKAKAEFEAALRLRPGFRAALDGLERVKFGR